MPAQRRRPRGRRHRGGGVGTRRRSPACPTPDRVFVGGGGSTSSTPSVPGSARAGVVVATYAVVDRAVAARAGSGSWSQLSVARAVPIGGLGVRLAPENPVFVCWGAGGEGDGRTEVTGAYVVGVGLASAATARGADRPRVLRAGRGRHRPGMPSRPWPRSTCAATIPPSWPSASWRRSCPSRPPSWHRAPAHRRPGRAHPAGSAESAALLAAGEGATLVVPQAQGRPVDGRRGADRR